MNHSTSDCPSASDLRDRRAHAGPRPEVVPGADEHELVLVKGERRYAFRCEPGGEAELIAQLRALAADPHSEVQWFDAALLSHHLGLRLRRPPASASTSASPNPDR